MDGFVRQLAARLLSEEFEGHPTLSRNRHFEVFSDAQGRRALRLFRHLRSLRRDLLDPTAKPARLEPTAAEAPLRLRLRIPLAGRRGTRTAYLSKDEFELLLETPALRAKFEG